MLDMYVYLRLQSERVACVDDVKFSNGAFLPGAGLPTHVKEVELPALLHLLGSLLIAGGILP